MEEVDEISNMMESMSASCPDSEYGILMENLDLVDSVIYTNNIQYAKEIYLKMNSEIERYFGVIKFNKEEYDEDYYMYIEQLKKMFDEYFGMQMYASNNQPDINYIHSLLSKMGDIFNLIIECLRMMYM